MISYPIDTLPNLAAMGSEVVADWDMSSSGVGSWSDYNTPTTKEKLFGDRGKNKRVIHVVGDAANDGIIQYLTGDPVVGDRIRVKLRILVISGSVRFIVSDGVASLVATTLSNSGWVDYEWDVVSTSTNWTVAAYTYLASGEFYISYASVKRLGALYGSWLNRKTRNSGRDYSPNGYDLTAVGSPTPLPVGYRFNGSSDYFRLAVSDWRSDDLFGTIMGWIKLNTLSVIHAIFASADEAADNNYFEFIVRNNDLLSVAQKNGVADTASIIDGSTALVAGQWYHVALVSLGYVYLLYLNGEAEITSTVAGSDNGDWLGDTSARDNITIGVLRRFTISNYIDGDAKDIRYYGRRIFSASEIKFEYRQGVPV